MMLLKPDVRGLVSEGDASTLILATSHWSAGIRAATAAARALGDLGLDEAAGA